MPAAHTRRAVPAESAANLQQKVYAAHPRHACREYGADLAINYRTQDFVQVAKEFTYGRGIDAIFDMVGGDYIPRELDLLARRGGCALSR